MLTRLKQVTMKTSSLGTQWISQIKTLITENVRRRKWIKGEATVEV